MDKYILSFEKYTWSSHSMQILVDGITISETYSKNGYEKFFGSRLTQNGRIILNFIGKIRPTLSIDRNSIVNCPEESIQIVLLVIDKLIKKVAHELINHLEQEDLDVNSDEARLAIEVVLSEYSDFSGELLELIRSSRFGALQIEELKKYTPSESTAVNDVMASNELRLSSIDFRTLDYITHELIIGKLLYTDNIQIDDDYMTISTSKYVAPSSLFRYERRDSGFSAFVIKVDNWSGKYAHYDIVSNIWPLVPERTFEKVSELYREDKFSLDKDRVKVVGSVGNGLFGIATLDPAMINPKFGISTCRVDPFSKKESLIGRCENVQNNYWLFELNDHGRLCREKQKDYALFVYIAPKELSDEDAKRLADYIDKDDIYIKGVREGWSILLLGYDQKYFILPGYCEKSSLIELIPASIRNRDGGITYYNLDETMLFANEI